MLWIYDEAISKDLSDAISADHNNIVKVADADIITDIMAQLQDDKITFPFVCLTRNEEYNIDTSRSNFVATKKGVPAGFDPKTNNIYVEKSIPIDLSYTLTILTTNTVDADEYLREIMFRYSSTYFVTAKVPYDIEGRYIRIGLTIDPTSIRKKSANLEYYQSGALYQTTLVLKCEGAVLLHYTPRHILNVKIEDGYEIVQS